MFSSKTKAWKTPWKRAEKTLCNEQQGRIHGQHQLRTGGQGRKCAFSHFSTHVHWRMDQPTDGPTDKGSYRVACPQLKMWWTDQPIDRHGKLESRGTATKKWLCGRQTDRKKGPIELSTHKRKKEMIWKMIKWKKKMKEKDKNWGGYMARTGR